ncbi:MAG: FAD-dependent oxidoreductase, partial [Deltaproteobacteria bacterium]
MKKPLLLLAILVAALILWRVLAHYVPDFAHLGALVDHIRTYASAHLVLSLLGFVALYAAVTGLSVPFAVPLTLIAGAVFGLFWGTIAVSFGSTAGATLAFLAARYLFRDTVTGRQGSRLAAIEQGLNRDGALYLFTLRLIPLVPFFAVNLLMGLTKMPVWTFWVTSQIGMFPGTLAYVNAGTELARIDSPSDILSLRLFAAFAILGLLPWVMRAALNWTKNRKLYARWTKPAKFDRNVIVIGAGSAGLVATYLTRALKGSVTLIERDLMGGDCLNTGCVPSKALIHFAGLAHEAKAAEQIGLKLTGDVDLKAIMISVQAAIATIAPNDSVERYQRLGAEVLKGQARLLDPWTVEITTDTGVEKRTARAIILATGAAPFVPEIPGLTDDNHVTSETLWTHLATLDKMPQRVAILGGGPIGCELAQAFARLGSNVTLIQRGARLLPNDENPASEAATQALKADGVDIRLNADLTQIDDKVLRINSGDTRADLVIIATGRAARLQGYGLEDLGLEMDKTLIVNDYLQTSLPNIFAAGDVAGPDQFTHAAGHQATTAAINAQLRGIWRVRYSRRVMPRVTFTAPEIASVGHTTA